MAIKNLSLESLKDFADGTVEASFNRHLKRAIEDCDDRAGDSKARKVTIEVLLSPQQLQDGSTCNIKAECKIKSSVPDHISRPIECRIKQGGKAVFNDLSPDNPDQMTLDQVPS